MGDGNNPAYQALKAQVNRLFNIKHWRLLPFTFLGIDLGQDKRGGYDDLASCVKAEKLPWPPERKLQPKEETKFRRLAAGGSLSQRVVKAVVKDHMEEQRAWPSCTTAAPCCVVTFLVKRRTASHSWAPFTSSRASLCKMGSARRTSWITRARSARVPRSPGLRNEQHMCMRYLLKHLTHGQVEVVKGDWRRGIQNKEHVVQGGNRG